MSQLLSHPRAGSHSPFDGQTCGPQVMRARLLWLLGRCGVVCGVVWCGVVWCGVVWCGVVWCSLLYDIVVCHTMPKCSAVQCIVVWFGACSVLLKYT